jgi:hypothetical protein
MDRSNVNSGDYTGCEFVEAADHAHARALSICRDDGGVLKL